VERPRIGQYVRGGCGRPVLNNSAPVSRQQQRNGAVRRRGCAGGHLSTCAWVMHQLFPTTMTDRLPGRTPTPVSPDSSDRATVEPTGRRFPGGRLLRRHTTRRCMTICDRVGGSALRHRRRSELAVCPLFRCRRHTPSSRGED